MAFSFAPTPGIPDLVVATPKIWRDDRGWFVETWKESEFRAQGIGPFTQDNHSGNLAAGIVRGLHFQLPPHAQGKLVRCVRGRVWDVAVDLRPGPTQFKHVGMELSATDQRMLWIPPGFAHGYCTLEAGSEVAYKTTVEYVASHDRALRWNDPALAIPWPVKAPILAPKDANAPLAKDLALPARWT